MMIVGVVAYFTPPDEPLAVGEATSSDESFATTSPSVVLPTVPVEISSEQLQAETIGEVEALRTRFPRLPEALHVAAMAYAGLQQTAKADEIWQICIGLERTYVGPRLGRAILMSERGNDAEAVEILQAALADGCSTPEVFYRLATAQSKLGDVEQAEATLRTALQTFPSVSELWLALGQTQNQLLQFEEAERSLRQAVNLGNESPSVFFALANACQRLGKQEAAAEYRQQFTALKKTSAEATADTPFQEIYEQALCPLIASTFASAGAVYARQGDSGAVKSFSCGPSRLPRTIRRSCRNSLVSSASNEEQPTRALSRNDWSHCSRPTCSIRSTWQVSVRNRGICRPPRRRWKRREN